MKTSFKAVQNPKAITPIISVILLLMMTIAIAGLAYSWLQKMQGSITTSTENRSSELLSGMKIELKIDGYYMNCSVRNNLTTFFVRNAGTETANNVRIFADDQYFVNGTGGTNSTYTRMIPGVMVSFAINATDGCNFFNDTPRTIKVVSDETSAEKVFTFSCSEGNCIGAT